VKDLLLNVGSGGGAAAVASSGAPAAGGAAAPEEAKEEEKEEGKYPDLLPVSLITQLTYPHQRRKSQTRIWVSDFSTKRLPLLLSVLTMHGSVFSSLDAIFAWTSCPHRMSKLI
jgi:hypothetical protein